MKALFTQSLSLCAQAGLVSLGRVALDGTKVRAAASRHRAMSYDRMVRAEAELAGEVEALLAEAQRLDAAEDAAYGTDRRGDELPVELTRREGRLAAIRTAKAALEAEHAAKARAQAEQDAAEQGRDPDQVTQAGDAAEAGAVVPDRAQRSFTDPDARIMKTSDGSFHYCFNAQAVVDAEHQVIVAADLNDCASDMANLIPLTEQAHCNTGVAPVQVLADAGYCSADNLKDAAQLTADTGTEFFIATGRRSHDEPAPPPPRGRIPADFTAKQRMARKLRTKPGAAAYARRKVIVEPVFGQMATLQNAKQLLLRGLDGAQGEWLLLAACHNLRKLHGHIGLAGLAAT